MTVEPARFGTWEWDLRSGAVVWSEEMYSIHGIEPGEFGGTPEAYALLVHPDDWSKVQEIIEHLLAGGAPRPVEYRIVRPDGRVRHLLGTNDIFHRENGEPARVMGTVRDISQLRQEAAAREGAADASQNGDALAALLRSEERFKALIENSYDVISVFGSDGTALYVTPSCRRVMGFEPEELIGRPGYELVHPDDLERVNLAFAKAVETPGATAHVIFRNRHKDGSYRTVEVTGTNLLDNEAVGGMVSNLRDITERHQADEALRQAQKMEAVGRLAGGVAHDFNNLLTVILAEVDIVLAGEECSEVVREALLRIHAAGEHASDLTRQLLSFSRKDLLEPVVLDLNQIVTDARDMLRRLIEESIELELDLEDDLWPVRADRAQLEQVLVNLAVNARDAMPDGGAIRIETANGTVSAERARQTPELSPGDYVRLRVRDNGLGMSEETRSHIFEPFFTTKSVQGTGLGLSTGYAVVKKHSGHIEVESAVGEGTTITLYLPRWRGAGSPSQRTDEAAARREALGTAEETVLVVEDEDSVRTVTAETLRRAGWTVITAASAEEALEVTADRSGAVDLLLTDVVLPGLGGRELAESIASSHPEIRVLFVTGYTSDDALRRSVEDNGLDLMRKPFMPGDLRRKVREILDRVDRG